MVSQFFWWWNIINLFSCLGGYGYDFSSDISKLSEGIEVVRDKLVSTGVTSFCPTIVTSPADDYKKVKLIILKNLFIDCVFV